MLNCEIFGFKHHLQLKGGSAPAWLTGDLYFKCRKCSAWVVVDRFYFYLALQLPREGGSRGHISVSTPD
ncbi:hypothetical protein PBI_CAMILLE_79 [Microbacterium phage Camille]|nr:hypothetical protein PBI_CAMILLE_79 [Microbacterium phage Camille]